MVVVVAATNAVTLGPAELVGHVIDPVMPGLDVGGHRVKVGPARVQIGLCVSRAIIGAEEPPDEVIEARVRLIGRVRLRLLQCVALPVDRILQRRSGIGRRLGGMNMR
jgi:hypothetical protein